jgi:hypothetical protein
LPVAAAVAAVVAVALAAGLAVGSVVVYLIGLVTLKLWLFAAVAAGAPGS